MLTRNSGNDRSFSQAFKLLIKCTSIIIILGSFDLPTSNQFEGIINEAIPYKVKTDYQDPTVGDCFTYESEGELYGLLVARAYEDMTVFVPINISITDQLTPESLGNSTINFHHKPNSTFENILSYLLGGDEPRGYFGFTVANNNLSSFLELLKYHCTFQIDLSKLPEIGGTSLIDNQQIDEVIRGCQAFRMVNKYEVGLSELTNQ